MTELTELQAWYQAQCDGDWEHSYGIKIGTLDNPGWNVTIDLVGTALEGHVLSPVEESYDHTTEWLRCWAINDEFHAVGGPLTLTRLLRIFLDWNADSPATSAEGR